MEKESENRLPFLDVLIDNNQVHVLTTVFRKSTFTGLLMNFTSFTSYSYKLGLIRTLIDRAYKINSTWLGFHQETTKIRDFLLKNSYPAHIIGKAINSTINKFFFSLTGKMATTAQSAPTLNYLTWANFLLLHKSGFAEPFSVFVTTALISS